MIDSEVGRDNPSFLQFEKRNSSYTGRGGDLTSGLVRENVTPNKINFSISI